MADFGEEKQSQSKPISLGSCLHRNDRAGTELSLETSEIAAALRAS